MSATKPIEQPERDKAQSAADDLPYRIVEEMGLGLTFRSCACGQLPCARLRPIKDALEAVRSEARAEVWKNAIEWAKKVQAVKLDAARDASNDDEFAAMGLVHEAEGAARVVAALEAAANEGVR